LQRERVAGAPALQLVVAEEEVQESAPQRVLAVAREPALPPAPGRAVVREPVQQLAEAVAMAPAQESESPPVPAASRLAWRLAQALALWQGPERQPAREGQVPQRAPVARVPGPPRAPMQAR